MNFQSYFTLKKLVRCSNSNEEIYCVGIVSGDSEEDQSTTKQGLISAFRSNKAENVKAEMRQSSDGHMQIVPDFARWSTNWWHQFTVLLSRGLKERKHDSFSALKIGQVLVVSFLTGLLWWKSDMAHIQDEVRYLLLQTFLTLWLVISASPNYGNLEFYEMGPEKRDEKDLVLVLYFRSLQVKLLN